MSRAVALLRGVNVGGRAPLSMEDLRSVFADLGYRDAQTYIRSGNVIFDGRGRTDRLAATIADGLERAFGRPIGVVVRRHAELADVLAGNPLAGEGRDDAHLHVTFLAATAGARRGPDAGPFAPDEFVVSGRHVYVHCPHGYGRSKLTNTFFERALGVTATTRNLRTVIELTRRSA